MTDPQRGEQQGAANVIVHRKLVRDRIPEIIAAEGSTPVVRVLEPVEYAAALRTKLAEEMHEYLAAAQAADRSGDGDTATAATATASATTAATEELADLLELLHALAALHECSAPELEALREQKRAARGGFAQRLWLEQVLLVAGAAPTDSVHNAH